MVARGRERENERGRKRGSEGEAKGRGGECAYPGPTSWYFGFLTENCGVLAKIYPILKSWQKWFRTVGRIIRFVCPSAFPKGPALGRNLRLLRRFLVRRSFSDRRRRQEQEDVSIVLERQTALRLFMASTLFMPGVDLCYQDFRFNKHRIWTTCVRQCNF